MREPYLADPDVTLWQGDCLEVLRELPDRSVDMVATSPPFYGLRDYGTGTWEGGDEGCDHKAARGAPRKFTNGRGEGTDDDYAGSSLRSWTTRDGTTFKDECGKCGARRVDRQIGLEEIPSCRSHGLMRLRADLTPDQRAFVARRLLDVEILDA